MTSTFALVAFGFYTVSDWILRKRPTTDRAVSSATATIYKPAEPTSVQFCNGRQVV